MRQDESSSFELADPVRRNSEGEMKLGRGEVSNLVRKWNPEGD